MGRGGFGDLFIIDVDGKNEKRLTSDVTTKFDVKWHPNGKHIVYTDLSGSPTDFTISIWEIDIQTKERRKLSGDYAGGISFSPEANLLAVDSFDGETGTRKIYILDLERNQAKPCVSDMSRPWFPSWSPNGRWVVFHAGKGGGEGIWLVKPDGTSKTRIVRSGQGDRYPAWSPDGKKIAFTRGRDEGAHIGILDLPSQYSARKLPGEPKPGKGVREAPDGSQGAGKAKIAFRSERDGNWEIYLMDADGGYPRRLTKNSANDDMPRWSADGKQIVFRSERDGNQEIYIMNSDGSQQRRLTENPAKDSNACFSPDGSKILFASKRSGNWDLYTMTSDGANQRRLTDKKLDSGGGRYSPGGNKIVFMSPRDGNFEVYVMDSDGSNITRLTTNPAVETGAIFSPTGRQIAFSSTRDGNFEIYVIDVGGSGLKNVTKNPANDAVCGYLDAENIVFFSDRTGDVEIYTTNLVTGKVSRITNSPGCDGIADVWVPPVGKDE